MKSNVFVKPDEQNKARFNSAMARKGAMKWNSHSVFATPKHLAFRLLKKFISQNCYLLSVICNAKNRFWKLLYCYIVTLGVNWRYPRNRNQSSCFTSCDKFIQIFLTFKYHIRVLFLILVSYFTPQI